MTLEPSPTDSLSHPPGRHDRWSRTRGALGDAVWQRLRESKVAVIGAGRNGSVAALTLGMLGVRQLVLIDGDRDEVHNLDATLGLTPDGIGQPKVANRRTALRRFRPQDLDVTAIAKSFMEPSVADELRDVQLIMTCVDRDTPRLAAAIIANRWCKPHLDIGTGVFLSDDEQGRQRQIGGDVRLLLPGQACVVCLGGLRNLEEARYELAAPPGALRRGRRQEWYEQRAGSLITINQIAVNLGIQMWLNLLAGQVTESRWCHLEWNQRGDSQIETVSTPGHACEICRRSQNTIEQESGA